MKPAPFDYLRPASLEQALEALADGGEDAKVLAGGQSLVPMMNLRLARPSSLVDIGDLPGLSYLLEEDGALRIGALTRHEQVEHYPGVLDGFALLPQAARWVGHEPIRARGTFGGSIAHADGAAEWCLVAMLLGAEISARSVRGTRTVAAEDFFVGPFTTTLEPDEILTEVRLPRGRAHAHVDEFARRHGDFAVVAAAVAFDLDAGRVRDARAVLGGVAGRPLVIGEVATTLEGEVPSPELFAEAGRVAAAAIDPPGDIHGSPAYRRELASTLVRRALTAAARTPGVHQ